MGVALRTVLRSVTALSGNRAAQGRPMYTGTLINDLLGIVDRVCDAYESMQAQSAAISWIESTDHSGRRDRETQNSEAEKLTKSLRLGTTDRNLGLLLVVHPQLVRTLEPGDHLADSVNVHQIGAVCAPK